MRGANWTMPFSPWSFSPDELHSDGISRHA
jgi:hypothetical protein